MLTAKNPVLRALTSLQLTIVCLALLMILVVAATLAQVGMGTVGAVNAYEAARAEAVLDLMRVSDPSFTFPPEVRLTSDQASEPVAEEPDAPKTTRPKKEKAAPAPSEPVGLVGAFKG